MKKYLLLTVILMLAVSILAKNGGTKVDYFDAMSLTSLKTVLQPETISKLGIAPAVSAKINKIKTNGQDRYLFDHGNMRTEFFADGRTELTSAFGKLSFVPRNFLIGTRSGIPEFKGMTLSDNRAGFTVDESVREEYIATRSQLKHNIYVKPGAVREAGDFTYEWEIDRGHFIIENGGEINKDFTTADDITLKARGKDVFKILKPFAYEKGKDKKVYGHYDVRFTGDKIILSLTVPMDAFRKASSEIVIDPTVVALEYAELWGTWKRNIAQDSKGNIYVAYMEYSNSYEIYVQRSSDGGTSWGTPKRLSYTNYDGYYPAIAIDGNDNIYVIWIDWDQSEISFSRSTDLGATWSMQKTISFTNQYGTDYYAIAAYGNGNVYVVYWNYLNDRIEFIRSLDGGATWSMAKMLLDNPAIGGNFETAFPTIETAGNGKLGVGITLKYYKVPGGYHIRVYYMSSEDTGSTWTVPELVQYDDDTSSGDVAVDAVSLSFDSSNNPYLFYSVRSNNKWGDATQRVVYTKYDGFLWSPVMVIDGEIPDNGYDPVISLDQNDNIYFTWTRYQDDTESHIRFISKIGGIWQDLVELSRSDNGYWEDYPHMPPYFNTERSYGGPFTVYYDYIGVTDDDTDYDDVLTFQYLGSSQQAPSAPVILYPKENGYSPGLVMWERSDSRMNVYYRLEFSTSDTFTTILCSADKVLNTWSEASTELLENTDYYVRVRTVDVLGRVSPWSATRKFITDNTAPVIVDSASEPDTVTGWYNIENPLALTFTGHDSGGAGIWMNNYFTDKDEFTEVTYNWIDIEKEENHFPITPGEDDGTVRGVPLNFLFPLYEAVFYRINICTNGWVSLDYDGDAWGLPEFPFNGNYHYTIAVYQDDQMTSRNGNSQLFIADLENPKRKVITFKDWSIYWDIEANLTYQVVLYETGQIDINIKKGSEYIDSVRQIGINYGYNTWDAITYYYSLMEGLNGPLSVSYIPRTFALTDTINIESDRDQYFSYVNFDKAGRNSTYSAEYFDNIDYGMPACTVTTPMYDMTVNQASITFLGTWSETRSGILDVQYSVNGSTSWVSVSTIGGGTWGTVVPLLAGENDIVFRALDVAGNIGESTDVIAIMRDDSSAYSIISGPVNGMKYTKADFPIGIDGFGYHGSAQTIDQIDVLITGATFSDTLSIPGFPDDPDWKTQWDDVPPEGLYNIRSRAKGDTASGWVESPNGGIWVTIGTETPTSNIIGLATDDYLYGDTWSIAVAASDLTSDIEDVNLGIRRYDEEDYTWYDSYSVTDWTFNWDIPQNEEAYYYLLSRATDTSGYVETNTVPLRIIVDTKAPYGYVTKPVSGNYSFSDFDLEGYAWDDLTGVCLITGILTDTGGNTTLFSFPAENGEFNDVWTFPETGAYTLTVIFTDNANNDFEIGPINMYWDIWDHTSRIFTPKDGDTIYDSTVMITGEAQYSKDDANITKVEVGITPQGGTTSWYTADGTDDWSYLWTGYDNGYYTIQSRSYGDTEVETPSAGIDILVNQPLPPEGLSAKGFDSLIRLTWSAPSTVLNPQGYILMKRAEGEEMFESVCTTSAFTFDDWDVTAGIRYEYAIKTVGENAQSGELSESIFITMNDYGTTLDDIICYPNPCVKSTGAETFKFAYLLPDTEILIYKINGELIKTIEADGPVFAWDLLDDNARTISTGIYIAVFKCGGESRTAKIAIVK